MLVGTRFLSRKSPNPVVLDPTVTQLQELRCRNWLAKEEKGSWAEPKLKEHDQLSYAVFNETKDWKFPRQPEDSPPKSVSVNTQLQNPCQNTSATLSATATTNSACPHNRCSGQQGKVCRQRKPCNKNKQLFAFATCRAGFQVTEENKSICMFPCNVRTCGSMGSWVFVDKNTSNSGGPVQFEAGIRAWSED